MNIATRKYTTAFLVAAGTLALAVCSSVTTAAPKNKENSVTTAATQPAAQPSTAEAIRPFRVHIPDEAIADLRRRIAATRWPDKETVADRSQGAQLEQFKKLVDYWGTD